MKTYFLFVSLLLMHISSCIFSSETKDLVMIYCGLSERCFSGALLKNEGKDSFLVKRSGFTGVIACSLFCGRFVDCSFIYGILVDPQKVYVYDKNCIGDHLACVQSRMTLFAYLQALKKDHDQSLDSACFGASIFDKDGKIMGVKSLMFRVIDGNVFLPTSYSHQDHINQDCIPYLELFTIK